MFTRLIVTVIVASVQFVKDATKVTRLACRRSKTWTL
jgi:hypothetical protein